MEGVRPSALDTAIHLPVAPSLVENENGNPEVIGLSFSNDVGLVGFVAVVSEAGDALIELKEGKAVVHDASSPICWEGCSNGIADRLTPVPEDAMTQFMLLAVSDCQQCLVRRTGTPIPGNVSVLWPRGRSPVSPTSPPPRSREGVISPVPMMATGQGPVERLRSPDLEGGQSPRVDVRA